MILKSYLVEQNIDVLKEYQATLIYGENNGIKDDVKEQIIKKNPNCEIITFFENEIIKTNLLHSSVMNQSLFSEKKIIIIQEASDKIFDQLDECLEKNHKEIQIFIFAENLEKRSKLRTLFEKERNLAIFACYEDNGRTLMGYINKELKDFKGLTGEITNLIIDNSNMNRKIIQNELNKIKVFFAEKKMNKTEILEILNIKNNTKFDEIRDKALMGEKIKVNQLLSETEILNDEVFFYLNVLNYRIMRLHEIIKINDNKENYERTVENLKPPIFWKDKPIVLQQLRKWSQQKIEDALIKINEIEVLMKKNSSIRNDVVIKNLIIGLTNKASTSY